MFKISRRILVLKRSKIKVDYKVPYDVNNDHYDRFDNDHYDQSALIESYESRDRQIVENRQMIQDRVRKV